MSDFDELLDGLKQARDEIQLHIHLASMDVRDEWADLEKRWEDFNARAELQDSSEGISTAMTELGEEFVKAFRRIRRAL